jgi:DNA polymerase type B, organellar and viral
MAKHGVWFVKGHDIKYVADQALQHRYTHIWVMPGCQVELADSIGVWSIKVNKRHDKPATISVWKRGREHIDIILLENTAWVEGVEAFKGISPKQLLAAIGYIESELGVPVSGSPASVGWALLKKLHPEWIEDIPVNLRDMHFTPQVGSDLIWQCASLGVLGSSLAEPTHRYIHKFEKNSAYPAAATMTDIGVGIPVHMKGKEAWLAAQHEKFHPQPVGVWRCTILYTSSLHSPSMPPVWKEDKGTYAATEGWLAGPIIRLLQSQGHHLEVHEGYVFPGRHDLLVKWAKLLWEKRQACTNECARKAFKQIANATIGFTAFKGFEDDEEEKRRPDIRLQILSRKREIMFHDIQEIRNRYYMMPIMVYMDAVYYFSDSPVLTFDYFKQREDKLGGFKYEGSIEITPEVAAMFAEKKPVASRLEYLNKIGWNK